MPASQVETNTVRTQLPFFVLFFGFKNKPWSSLLIRKRPSQLSDKTRELYTAALCPKIFNVVFPFVKAGQALLCLGKSNTFREETKYLLPSC